MLSCILFCAFVTFSFVYWFLLFPSVNKMVKIVKTNNSWANGSLNTMASFNHGCLWLLGADCEICEITQSASFLQHGKSAGCSRSMMVRSQEVFCVPGTKNTRPTERNAFTCHIQGHPVITLLGRQPEHAVLQWFHWHFFYMSSSREGEQVLPCDISTATREVKRTGNYPAFTTSPKWEMLKWGFLSLLEMSSLKQFPKLS